MKVFVLLEHPKAHDVQGISQLVAVFNTPEKAYALQNKLFSSEKRSISVYERDTDDD